MSNHESYLDEVNNYFDALPDSSFKEVTCFFCWKTQDRVFLFRKGSMEVYRCRCGFVYNGRQPNNAALDGFYSKSNAMDKWADLKQTWEEKHRQYEKFNRVVSYLVDHGIKTVLDVGCGNGEFLHLLPKSMRRVGVEMNPYAADIARRKGLFVHEWTIDEMFTKFERDLSKFDAVCLWGVLEHYYNPMAILKKIRRVLNPKGKLIICVPNVNSLVVQTLGKKCFTFCPQHLWYFDRTHLVDLLRTESYNPKCSWTIEAEAIPVLKSVHAIEDPYAKIPEWFQDQIHHFRLPDILGQGLGYKIVMIGEAC